MKRFVSLTMAVFLAVAFTVPVFAASPTTSTVQTTPVTVPTNVTVTKGYTLTDEEQALVATTLEEAVALSTGVLVDPVAGTPVLATTVSPELIAMAKADILKNPAVIKALKARGVLGAIVNSGMLLRGDGTSAKHTINLSSAGLVPGQKVAILYFLPGDVTPRLAYPVWSNGKLRVTLPLPCVYNIVK